MRRLSWLAIVLSYINGCFLLGEDCGTCGNNLWPSLVLGTPTEAGVESVSIKEGGQTRRAGAGYCPGEFDLQRHLCSWSYSTGSNETVVVTANIPNGPITTSVELKKDACANDIAYVELVPTEAGTWMWSEVEYSNPCKRAGIE